MAEQYEIGLLGLLVREGGAGLEMLVQAKSEPGDIEGLQAAPTVQATRSNAARAHGGGLPPALTWFKAGGGPVLADFVQREHASFFLRKMNRNRVRLVEGTAPDGPLHRWLPVNEVAQLLDVPNRLNMSLRAVLATFAVRSAPPAPLPDWYRAFGHGRRMTLARVALTAAEDDRIALPFVRVRALAREVGHWNQPMLRPAGGLVEQWQRRRRDGRREWLVRAAPEPGNRGWLALAPTRTDYASDARLPERVAFCRRLEEIKSNVLFEQRLSEDGGRFFRFENRYRIVETDVSPGPLPLGYGWLDEAHVRGLAARGLAAIDLMSIIAIDWLRGHRNE